jgi:hypothetical protein
METRIEIKKELGGNVKVSIEIGRETWVFVWKMTEAEAMAEAEEMTRRLAA